MKARILLIDIETSPMLGYVWGLFQQNIGLNQLYKDRFILSFSAKWLGEKKIIYHDQRNEKNIENDKSLCEKIWPLIDEAQIMVSHNGKKFDLRTINARFVANDLPPPTNLKHIDTLRIARKYFNFTSNKLEYIANLLCPNEKKYSHAKFSGFDLWRECLSGNQDAWKEMEKYNKQDVVTLEAVYNKLYKWDNSIMFSMYDEINTEYVCNCGSTDFVNNGYNYTPKGKVKRLKCRLCHSNYTIGKNNIKSS